MVSVIFGMLAVILGTFGMRRWSGDLIQFLKGMLPIALFISGIIAIIAGSSSRKHKSSSKEKGP
jgi:hypothetical protein